MDAIAQSGWCGAVFETVAEMGAALTAVHFDAAHTMAVVFCCGDALGIGRRIKTGPASPGVKFVGTAE